ncbi:MAG: GNAT family N-acetyltransferase [Acidobacteriota bacterium]
MIRPARSSDCRRLIELRLAVKENVLTDPSWLTEAIVDEAVGRLGRGWVWEETGEIRGFSIVLERGPEIWALFVEPEFEGRGIGRALLRVAVDWAWRQGAERIKLSTDPQTRAATFYRRQGWQEVGKNAQGEVILVLRRPPDQGIDDSGVNRSS